MKHGDEINPLFYPMIIEEMMEHPEDEINITDVLIEHLCDITDINDSELAVYAKGIDPTEIINLAGNLIEDLDNPEGMVYIYGYLPGFPDINMPFAVAGKFETRVINTEEKVDNAIGLVIFLNLARMSGYLDTSNLKIKRLKDVIKALAGLNDLTKELKTKAGTYCQMNREEMTELEELINIEI